MPHGELSIDELSQHLDGLLDAGAGKDYGPNGLQVEGRRPIRKVATGVSACVELFERARDAGADAVLVHHGLFWDDMPRAPHRASVPPGRRRCSRRDPSARLPPAARPPPGARQQRPGSPRLRALHRSAVRPTRRPAGRLSGPLSRAGLAAELVERCAKSSARSRSPSSPVRRRCARRHGERRRAREVHQAIAAGLDAYITGEVSEWVMNVAREARIHYLAAGTTPPSGWGSRLSASTSPTRFGLALGFVDIPNPV